MVYHVLQTCYRHPWHYPFKTSTQTLFVYLCSASATVNTFCSHSFLSVLITLNNNNNKQYLWSQEELVATSNTQQVKDDVSHSKVKTFLKRKKPNHLTASDIFKKKFTIRHKLRQKKQTQWIKRLHVGHFTEQLLALYIQRRREQNAKWRSGVLTLAMNWMILTKMLRGVSLGVTILDPLGKRLLTMLCSRLCVAVLLSHFILTMYTLRDTETALK